MRAQRFWAILAVITLATLAALFLLEVAVPPLDAFSGFTVITTIVFSAIVGGAFLIGTRAARSPSRSLFVSVMLGVIMLKMFICIALVLAYMELYAPVDKLFVLPFLMIYIIFTIFEVIVLEQVARLEPQTGNDAE